MGIGGYVSEEASVGDTLVLSVDSFSCMNESGFVHPVINEHDAIVIEIK
jgi:hypothetical protein